MNYKKILQNTLSQEATLMVNKKLMAKYGLELATLIAYLIDQERYHDGEEFYCTDNNIKLYTGINSHRLSTIKMKGEDAKVFRIVKKGMPIKSFYYIDHVTILKEISSDDTVTDLAITRELGNVEVDIESIPKLSRNQLRLLSKDLGIPYTGKDLKSTLMFNIIKFLQLPKKMVTDYQEKPSLVTKKNGHKLPRNLEEIKKQKNLETKNKETVVAIEKNPAAASEETFFKNLKELLIKNNFKNYNSQTLKNLENYSEGDLEEIKKVIKFMKLKNKAINSKILVAILKDGDHKVVEPVDLKKVTKKEKLTHMLKITSQNEITDLCNRLAEREGFKEYEKLSKPEENIVNIQLEKILCDRYNKLNIGRD